MTETLEQRLARLEKTCAIQQRLIGQLGSALRIQQASIEALARLAGVPSAAQPAKASAVCLN